MRVPLLGIHKVVKRARQNEFSSEETCERAPPPRPSSPFSSDLLFQRLAVQTEVRDHLLHAAVLLLEPTKALRLADLHAAVLRLPAVQGLHR
jgi:hypothetical protein